MRRGLVFLLSLVLTTAFFSCSSSSTSDEQLKLEKTILDNYVKKNNITVAPRLSGLYYIQQKAGVGQTPSYGDLVTVKYTGKLLDGTVFDTETITYRYLAYTAYGGYLLDSMLIGFDEGVGLTPVGGKATVIFPSTLGYGSSATTSIPSYSSLVFDMEILKIVQN